MLSSTHPKRIRDVRLIDNGVFVAKKSLAQRIRGRKNRLIQRVLVACHLAEPSRDVVFMQAQHSTKAATDQLTAIRNGLFAHSQSIVNLSVAICCFTGSSARLHDNSQDTLADVSEEGYKIRDSALAFSHQVEKTILAQIDRRLIEFEQIQSLIEERAKLVLDVDYARRTLAMEQQKGNTNHIAERKQALQSAQRDCERTTRSITDHLKVVHPEQDDDMLALFQEYALLVAQFFRHGADLVGAEAK
ncbi:uncharacterized protein IUM83_06331 [Phytophthora cinnamomi]|uniref:uncharacterized protein n=1 Tax=Phytophthora cinnamomi TaxID=4785 RepID=UPI00355A584F|nr:hypothetical protein IUM83_06331 [Phytophthora cinnamomi]